MGAGLVAQSVAVIGAFLRSLCPRGGFDGLFMRACQRCRCHRSDRFCGSMCSPCSIALRCSSPRTYRLSAVGVVGKSRFRADTKSWEEGRGESQSIQGSWVGLDVSFAFSPNCNCKDRGREKGKGTRYLRERKGRERDYAFGENRRLTILEYRDARHGRETRSSAKDKTHARAGFELCVGSA